MECHAAVGWTHAANVLPARISQRLAEGWDAIADIAMDVRQSQGQSARVAGERLGRELTGIASAAGIHLSCWRKTFARAAYHDDRLPFASFHRICFTCFVEPALSACWSAFRCGHAGRHAAVLAADADSMHETRGKQVTALAPRY